jgi:acetyl-CoA synthetase
MLFDGEGFDAELHLQMIEDHKVTTFCAPPTIYRLFAQMDVSGYDLSSLRHCLGAGEPLNPEAMRAWKAATGCDVYDGYGQTETVNIVANFPGMEIRPGSMGKPVPGLTIAIIDEDGNIVDDEVVGHIAVKITDPHPLGLFHGYFRDPDGTAPSETAGITPAIPQPATVTAIFGSLAVPMTLFHRQAIGLARLRWKVL